MTEKRGNPYGKHLLTMTTRVNFSLRFRFSGRVLRVTQGTSHEKYQKTDTWFLGLAVWYRWFRHRRQRLNFQTSHVKESPGSERGFFMSGAFFTLMPVFERGKMFWRGLSPVPVDLPPTRR
jgi:hypothetical protein